MSANTNRPKIPMSSFHFSAKPRLTTFKRPIRQRFRSFRRLSYEHPEPIVANEVDEYTIDLHGNDHAFLKDHRIMVQVQSSWFPFYDRNKSLWTTFFGPARAIFKPPLNVFFAPPRYPSHVSVSLALMKNN